MKTLNLTLAFLLAALISQAQYDTTKIDLGKSKVFIITEKGSDKSDTIRVNVDNVDFDGIDSLDEDFDDECENKFNSHWGGIGLGLNSFMNESGGMGPLAADDYLTLDQGKSWGVSLNLIETNITLYKQYIGLSTGLGMEFNNYRFSKNYIFTNDSASLYAYYDSTTSYQKNKLVVPWVTMPFIVEFKIPVSDKNINIGFGVLGAVRLGGHTKMVYDYKGNDIKDKQRGDFHMNWYRYGLTGQIGYGSVGIFVNYSLSTLFKDDEGPELYPWSAGIHLAF